METPSWTLFALIEPYWGSQDTGRDVTRIVQGRCGESASEVWGESDLNPVLRANSYTHSKPPKPRGNAMLQPGLSFVLASVCPPVIYTAQVGLASIWSSHKALGVSKAVGQAKSNCSFSSNIGCCHAPTGVTFKFQRPFQVALFRQLRAYQKYSNLAARHPAPSYSCGRAV